MGLRSDYPRVMEWHSTLAGMLKHGAVARAMCPCGHWWDWPVEDLITELGSDRASLWDRHPPCELPTCEGAVLFHASAGPGTASRPMISPFVPSGGLPIQSLCDGWLGMDRKGPR
jgi:hypothetical protein